MTNYPSAKTVASVVPIDGRTVFSLLWFSSLSLEYGLLPLKVERWESFFFQDVRWCSMLAQIPKRLKCFQEAMPIHLGSVMVLGYCLFFRASVKQRLWKERGWRVGGEGGRVWGEGGGDSWPIQHIWNIWGLEVCSNAERHSEAHKETFSPSFLLFFSSKTSSSVLGTIFRRATDYFLFYEAFGVRFKTRCLVPHFCILFCLRLSQKSVSRTKQTLCLFSCSLFAVSHKAFCYPICAKSHCGTEFNRNQNKSIPLFCPSSAACLMSTV